MVGVIQGVGDLIYDHVFVWHQGELTYLTSRGGGPVFNVLANVALYGGTAKAVGVGGQDWRGDAAAFELQELGIDVSGIRMLPGRLTRSIFHEVVPRELAHGNKHEFKTKCPICSSKDDDRKKVAVLQSLKAELLREEVIPDFVCFDRLTRLSVTLAQRYRELGAITVLDIGRIGFLRYRPAALAIGWLRDFDIVQMTEQVHKSLLDRTALTSDNALEIFSPRMFSIITKGSEGLILYDHRPRATQRVMRLPGISGVTVTDDAGAGDVLLARFVYELSNLKSHKVRVSDADSSLVASIADRSISSVSEVIQVNGARGHLPRVEASVNSPIACSEGLPVKDLRRESDREGICPFCGYSRYGRDSDRHSKRRTTIAMTTSHLVDRIVHSTACLDAVMKCREILESESYRTAYVVGTGGSYPAAAFVSLILGNCRPRTMRPIVAQPIRPMDYVITGVQTDCMLVMSYSGKTQDCAEAIQHARALDVPDIFLLTRSTQSPLTSKLRSSQCLISYGKSSGTKKKQPGERGFISMAGTVVPCAIWSTAAVGPRDMAEFSAGLPGLLDVDGQFDETQIAKLIEERQTISVIGSGWAWPAMLDLESKFIESNLTSITLHESKDFSHGRFLSVLGKKSIARPVIALGVGEPTRYERALLDALADGRPMFVIRTSRSGVLGGLELLIRVQFLIRRISNALHTDVSRPSEIPPKGLELYHWSLGL